jgi:hypothetical protein
MIESICFALECFSRLMNFQVPPFGDGIQGSIEDLSLLIPAPYPRLCAVKASNDSRASLRMQCFAVKWHDTHNE